MKGRKRHLDLQAKISLVLVAVIIPTFVIVTIAENKLTLPILEEEVRQLGVHTGKSLAAEIVGARLFTLTHPTPAIENALQEVLYSQPDIIRVDVALRNPATGAVFLVASNVDDDPGTSPPVLALVDSVTSAYKLDESGDGVWDINVPIETRSRDPRGPKRLLGVVHVVVSTKLVGRITSTLWKTTATAASFSVVALILVLSYFLRKTLKNDRLLKRAEFENFKLMEQLHETQRELMISEKLAVMGQLTASFAHEIGTPLNAIGGHLQLLKEEVPVQTSASAKERLEIVNGQLTKIEGIVKSFLQSTAKPTSQKQLTDLNRLVEKTLGIVRPRMSNLDVEIRLNLDREMGPMRLVPLDVEQVFLNLLNNSLDSIESKQEKMGFRTVRFHPKQHPKLLTKEKFRSLLEITSNVVQTDGNPWAHVVIYDTGEGICKADLKNVLKAFFTTKRPGEGTGLGLTICQQLAQKYGGELFIDSKEGAWTRVTLKLPYHVNT